MTDKLTDETHICVDGWGEMNDGPDIALLAERIVDNNLDGGRRHFQESADRLTGLLIAFGEHLISAERTALRASEERVKSLTAELEAVRDALLLAVRRERDCVRGEETMCGALAGWDAEGCLCASDARDMVSTLTAPDKGETM